MSTESHDKVAALQGHLDTLVRQVWVPAFLGSLADRGIVPRTEKEAAELCRMGEMLILADQAEQSKQAAANAGFYGAAADQLEQLLYGDAPAVPDVDPRVVKQAAAAFLKDPAIAAAAMALSQAVITG